jgi:hypothetical protein
LIGLLLSACKTSDDVPPPPPPPIIPALPTDLANCRDQPIDVPLVELLDDEEIEKLWARDRVAIVRLSKCNRRLVCHARAIRHDIGKVSGEPVCPPARGKIK